MRDFALVYYCLFAFFTAAALERSPDILERLIVQLNRFVPWLLLWLPFAVILGRTVASGANVPFTAVPITTHKAGDAAIAALVALGSLWLFPAGRSARSRELWSIMALIVIALVATQNRGGLLSAVAGLAVGLAFFRDRMRLIGRAVAVTALVVSVGTLLSLQIVGTTASQGRAFSASQLFANVASIGGVQESGNLNGTVQGRTSLWSQTLHKQISDDRLVHGYGFGPNLAYLAGGVVASGRSNNPLRSPHNSDLDILARMGVVGMSLWIALWVGWYWRLVSGCRRLAQRGLYARRRVAVLCLMVDTATLVSSFFDPQLEGAQAAVLMWTAFGIGLAVTSFRAWFGDRDLHLDRGTPLTPTTTATFLLLRLMKRANLRTASRNIRSTRLRHWYWLVALLVVGCSGVTSHPASPSPACTGRALTPTSNVQTAINDAAPGTTFCFWPGTYHVSALIPKSGDVLDGDGQAAVLDGGNSASYAIYGDSASPGPSDVIIRGFVIRNFRTPLQQGAIQDFNGPAWLIQGNHITHNAAAGVATGDKVKVVSNLIDYNAQEGFAAHGYGGLFEDNDIAYNNLYLAVDPRWEAGGGKAWATDNLTFESNYVHNNGGTGLWADTNNINTTFDHNTVSNNRGAGISEEISYNATITNNLVTGNAMPSAPGGNQGQRWGWDAGIQLRASGGLSSSSPVIIADNTVTDNFNGITLLQSPSPNACPNKGEGLYGLCRVQNVIVENNYITMSQGTTGEMQDGTSNSIFTSWNNHWFNNHYCVASAVHPDDGYSYGWFAWMNRNRSWSAWQRYGLDTGGTFKVGGTCSPS